MSVSSLSFDDITNTSEALVNFLVNKINNTLKSSKHIETLCKNGTNDLNLFTAHYFDSKALQKKYKRTKNCYPPNRF